MEKVILTTGGTGGHIFPALAVAEELRKRWPHIRLLFMGSLRGPEGRLAADRNIPFEGLKVQGFLGRGLKALPAAMNMLGAVWKARDAMRRFQPDVVAGFGGYASFAPMLAAKLLGVPALLHEQNAIAGSGNRLLAKFAKQICVSLPGTKGFSASTVFTGNPVRAAIARLEKKTRQNLERPRLLVLGGSQGAHALNMFIIKILPELRKKGFELRHQCGSSDLKAVQDAYASNGYDTGCAAAFIDDMAAAYEWADLAFCRAGASTVAELCAVGLPAVFVPFPAAIHDHQTLNAQALVEKGAAMLVPEKNLDGERVLRLLDELLNAERLAQMSEQAANLAKKDAASLLVDMLGRIAK